MEDRPRKKYEQVDRVDKGRPSGPEVDQRFRERDQREASDTRTVVERMLGDPAPERSALGTKLPKI